MICDKCTGPMKQYTGFNKVEWFCDNQYCGEDKEITEKINTRGIKEEIELLIKVLEAGHYNTGPALKSKKPIDGSITDEEFLKSLGL